VCLTDKTNLIDITSAFQKILLFLVKMLMDVIDSRVLIKWTVWLS